MEAARQSRPRESHNNRRPSSRISSGIPRVSTSIYYPPEDPKIRWRTAVFSGGLGSSFALAARASLAQGDAAPQLAASIIAGAIGLATGVASDALLNRRSQSWLEQGVKGIRDMLTHNNVDHTNYCLEPTPFLPDFPYDTAEAAIRLRKHTCDTFAHRDRCEHGNKIMDEGLLTIGSYTVSRAARWERFHTELNLPPNTSAGFVLGELLSNNDDGYNTPIIREIIQARKQAHAEMAELQHEVTAAKARKGARISLPTDDLLLPNPELLHGHRQTYRTWLLDPNNPAPTSGEPTPIDEIDTRYIEAWKQALGLTIPKDPADRLRDALDRFVKNNTDTYQGADDPTRAVHDKIFEGGIGMLNSGGVDDKLITQATAAIRHAEEILQNLTALTTKTKTVTPADTYDQFYADNVHALPNLPHPDSL